VRGFEKLAPPCQNFGIRRHNVNESAQHKILAEGRFLKLTSVGGWECVERKGAAGVVCIVAVTPERRLILVEQFRPPVGKRVVELPAGLAGDDAKFAGESLADAAGRELLEETGYSAESLRELGTYASSAGLTNETVTFFAADSIRRERPGGGDGTEAITVHEVASDDIDRWLHDAAKSDRLVDARVYTGLYLLGREISKS
jgi:ADP-ribose pyrophosphatase